MDEKGQVLFDNLAWFAKKLCSVMTSTSGCEHMWSIDSKGGYTTNVGTDCRRQMWKKLFVSIQEDG
jgi:hypothetical protein